MMAAVRLRAELPEALRADFAAPRGFVAAGDIRGLVDGRQWARLACVGDYVSRLCVGLVSAAPNLLVVDGRTRRGESLSLDELMLVATSKGYEVVRVENPPGSLSIEALEVVCDLLKDGKSRALVVVDGEEDMLAMACLHCAPPGSLVIYGVPGKGSALVPVDISLSREVQTRLLRLQLTFNRTRAA